MCGAGENESVSDAPLFLSLCRSFVSSPLRLTISLSFHSSFSRSLPLVLPRDDVFSGRFAGRLTIAGNYLPLPPRARHDACSTCGDSMAASSSLPRRVLSSPLVLPLAPLSPALSFARAIEDGYIADDRRRRSGSLVFLLSFAFGYLCFVCLRRLYMHIHARARAWSPRA